MGVVVSFVGYTPAARFDGVPWTQAKVEEALSSTGDWTLIDTLALTPDPDPSNPSSRNLTTPNGTADDLWYRLIFVDGVGGESEATTPVRNVPASDHRYADVDELARLLKITGANLSAREVALARVLDAAALEIDKEIGRTEPFGFSDDPQALALLAEVNLERAVEHWQQGYSPFGVIGLGAETGPVLTARDSWDRHARKLAPLKGSWGLA